LDIYNQVIEKFEDSKGELKNQVALALHNKSILLSELQREDELLEVCDSIIEKFSQSKDEMIMNIVASAEVIKDKDRYNNNTF